MMVKRALVLLLALSVLTGVVHAQDSSAYRLRTPTVAEFLAEVSDAVTRWHQELPPYYGKLLSQPMAFAIANEIRTYYSDDSLFAQNDVLLSNSYQALQPKAADRFTPRAIRNEPAWLNAILMASLRDHPTDFSKLSSFSVPPLFGTMTVHPVDFDGDGIDEYWLESDWVDHYSAYIVLQVDSSRPEGYRIIPTDPFWIDGLTGVDVPEGHKALQTISLLDNRENGRAEWIVFASQGRCGSLYAMSLQGGVFQNLLPEKSNFCSPQNISVENLDADPALEIFHHDAFSDNWECRWTVDDIFDWIASRYVRSSVTSNQDTLGCALRKAEPLMWSGHPDQAIPDYEHGLSVSWDAAETPDDDARSYQRQLTAYAQLRLALAYALDGQAGKARDLLDGLDSRQMTSEVLLHMLNAMKESSLEPYAICAAAFEVWRAYDSPFIHYSDIPITVFVGSMDDVYDNRAPDAAKAGCDLPEMLGDLLATHRFPSTETPVDALANLGVAVERAEQFDLDGDGQDEWIVWPAARVDPIFFAANGDFWSVSRPTVRRPSDAVQISTQPLPDSREKVVVDWAYLDGDTINALRDYYDVGASECVDEKGTYQQLSHGEVRLWQMKDQQLVLMQKAPLCQHWAAKDLFSGDGRQLHASAIQIPSPYGYDDKYADAVYTWDSSSHTYIPPQAPIVPTATTIVRCPAGDSACVASSLTDAALFDAADEAQLAFEESNFTAALSVLDNAINNADPRANAVIVNGLHYWRALTLEQLDRPDDALADYVAIVQAAPDSSWGRLAALHLEPAS